MRRSGAPTAEQPSHLPRCVALTVMRKADGRSLSQSSPETCRLGAIFAGQRGGQGRGRTADLPLFRRNKRPARCVSAEVQGRECVPVAVDGCRRCRHRCRQVGRCMSRPSTCRDWRAGPAAGQCSLENKTYVFPIETALRHRIRSLPAPGVIHVRTAQRDISSFPTKSASDSGRPRIHRAARYFTAYMSVMVLVGLVLISPLALQAVGLADGVNWTRLSDIGQAYGAVSALLSALAFSGIAVSLFIQARQARAAELQTTYSMFVELMRITLDDPETYAPCWEPLAGAPSTPEQVRRHVFSTMIGSYLETSYRAGVSSEAGLRSGIHDLLQGEVPRQHWQRVRSYWLARAAPNSKQGRFARLLEGEYAKVIAEGQPPISSPLDEVRRDPKERRRSGDWAGPVGTIAGLAGGLLIGAALHRKKQ